MDHMNPRGHPTESIPHKMDNPVPSKPVQSNDNLSFPFIRSRRDNKGEDREKREKIVQFMELSKDTPLRLLRARGRGDLSVFSDMAMYLDQNNEVVQSRWKAMKDDYDVAQRV
jgi:hypothetical protein